MGCVRGETPAGTQSSNARQSAAWEGLANEQIRTVYEPPQSRRYQTTYDIIRSRKALEELSAFLSPLRLPHKLDITTIECGRDAWRGAFYARPRGIFICYETMWNMSSIAHNIRIRSGFTADEVILGAFANIALHEMAHAIFDQLGTPVLGREEDAADQLAAFVILNLGKDTARRVLAGYIQLWRAMDSPWNRFALFDEHGAPLQRYYNVLCIAYGGQPATFKQFVAGSGMPRQRADGCKDEYRQAQFAFEKTITPHIDQERLRRVLAIEWAIWRADYRAKLSLFWDDSLYPVLGVLLVTCVLVAVLPTPLRRLVERMTRFDLRYFGEAINRQHWWAYMAAAIAAHEFLAATLSYLRRFELPIVLQYCFALITYCVDIAVLYWIVLFGIQRLNDRKRSRWWVMLLFGPSAVVFLAPRLYSGMQGSPDFLWGVILVAALLWLLTLLEMGFRRGRAGRGG
jgi:uncharacterized membrane protein YhaH (DUF805 family)